MIGTSSTFHSLPRCSLQLCTALPDLQSTWHQICLQHLEIIKSVLMYSVVTGALVHARVRFAWIAASMACALFVARDIGPRTMSNVPQPSNVMIEHEQQETCEKVVAFIKSGPQSFCGTSSSLKRKAIDFLDAPRYQWGYVWTDSTSDNVSPSACYTEYMPPLPSPPQHLVKDAAIQASIHALGDSIKVEMPFDVNKFELLLINHLNQPFIWSVMKGLWEGFGLLTRETGRPSFRNSCLTTMWQILKI